VLDVRQAWRLVLQFGTDEAIGYALPGALNGLSVLRLAFPPHPQIGAPSRTRTCTSCKDSGF
jgi:hypothetical protein